MHAFLHISQSRTKHRSLGPHRSQVQVKALLMHKWQGVGKTKTYRAVNPPRLQILRIDGEGRIDDVIMHGT